MMRSLPYGLAGLGLILTSVALPYAGVDFNWWPPFKSNTGLPFVLQNLLNDAGWISMGIMFGRHIWLPG